MKTGYEFEETKRGDKKLKKKMNLGNDIKRSRICVTGNGEEKMLKFYHLKFSVSKTSVYPSKKFSKTMQNKYKTQLDTS